MWYDIDIGFTCITALAGGAVAGWFTRHSALRGLVGFAVAVFFGAAFMFMPRAVSAFRLWLYLPQEISLPQEMLVAGIVPLPLATVLAGIGWLFGFAQYRRCTE